MSTSIATLAGAGSTANAGAPVGVHVSITDTELFLPAVAPTHACTMTKAPSRHRHQGTPIIAATETSPGAVHFAEDAGCAVTRWRLWASAADRVWVDGSHHRSSAGD